MGTRVEYSFGVFKIFEDGDFPMELHDVFCTDACKYGEEHWAGDHDLQWDDKELKASAEKAFGEGSRVRVRKNEYTGKIGVINELSHSPDGLYWMGGKPFIDFQDGVIVNLTSLREELKKIGLVIDAAKCKLGVFDATS